MDIKTYLFASTKAWHLSRFAARRPALPGRWITISDAADLTDDLLQSLRPRYAFFPHWSARVPDHVLNATECVCFHMTDVPYGRGGSPLQNLILRGHAETQLSALRMVGELDAGPVYAKRCLDLSGSAQDIFERSADLCLDLMEDIVRDEPEPTAQIGESVVFKRRRPEESRLPVTSDPHCLYDFIRMLDAETYPRAFLDHGPLRLNFRGARLSDGALTATVSFETRGNESA